MADETTNVATQPTGEATTPSPQSNITKLTRHIVGITQDTNGNNRYYFELDGEPFKGFNKNNELVEDKTSFSKNLITIMRQVGAKTGLLNPAYAAARVKKGARVNPIFVSWIFQNSEITIEREYKEATAEANANDPDDVNGKDRYVTTFKDLKLNIDPSYLPLIASALKSNEVLGEPLIIVEAEQQKQSIVDMAESLFA